MSAFSQEYGFERNAVGLHNWRKRPFSAWSFQHVGEIVPCDTIAAGPCAHPRRPSAGLDDPQIITFLKDTDTDVFVVSRSGKPLMDWHAGYASPGRPHILFSISKSITGLLAGILQDQGVLDPIKPVAHYLPEAGHSGFGDCPLQHVLDMRVSLKFTEDYTDPVGDFARYRQATGWNPPATGEAAPGLEEFLYGLAKGSHAHGGTFCYLSPNTDLLGLVLQRIAGQSYAAMMSELLWQPLGATIDAAITVDGKGAPRAAGGIAVVAQDLLRLGEMLLAGGTANGRQIVSERGLNDMRHNGDAEAWAKGDYSSLAPGGRYRNQWYQLAAPDTAFFGVGIHGQWLFVDPASRTVIVKLSSQDMPLDEPQDLRCLDLFRQISAKA